MQLDRLPKKFASRCFDAMVFDAIRKQRESGAVDESLLSILARAELDDEGRPDYG